MVLSGSTKRRAAPSSLKLVQLEHGTNLRTRPKFTDVASPHSGASIMLAAPKTPKNFKATGKTLHALPSETDIVLDAVRTLYNPGTPLSATFSHSRSSSSGSTSSLDSADDIASPTYSPKQTLFNRLFAGRFSP